MILAVDVMGFENKVAEAVAACRNFLLQSHDVSIILVGDETKIKPLLNNKDNFQIHHASEEVAMDAEPLAVRNNKNTSMYQAIQLVQNNQADGVLSAGNTGCYVFLTYMLFGLLPEVQKVGLMPYIPTPNNQGVYLLDVGANKILNPQDLLVFGQLATTYLESVLGKYQPKVAIVNIGTEANKGLTLQIEAHALLQKAHAVKNINYIGFLEPRDLFSEKADILLTDGFTGNIILKTLEGTFKTIFNTLLTQYKKPQNWLGFVASLPALLKIKKKFDYKNNAGAIVLGLNKIAVKTHGSADYQQFLSALRLLQECVAKDLITRLKTLPAVA